MDLNRERTFIHDLIRLYLWFRKTVTFQGVLKVFQVLMLILMILCIALTIKNPSYWNKKAGAQTPKYQISATETYLPIVQVMKFHPTEMASGWGGRRPKLVCTGSNCPTNNNHHVKCSNTGFDEFGDLVWKCELYTVPKQTYDLHKSTMYCLQGQLGKGYVVKGSCYIVFSTQYGGVSSGLNYVIVFVTLMLVFLFELKRRASTLTPTPTPSEEQKAEALKAKQRFEEVTIKLQCALTILLISKTGHTLLTFLYPVITGTYIIDEVV